MTFQQDSIISEEPETNHYLDAIGTAQESSWSVKLCVDSQEITFKIDTGAKVTAFSEQVYEDLRRPTLQKPSNSYMAQDPVIGTNFRQHCTTAKTPPLNNS